MLEVTWIQCCVLQKRIQLFKVKGKNPVAVDTFTEHTVTETKVFTFPVVDQSQSDQIVTIYFALLTNLMISFVVVDMNDGRCDDITKGSFPIHNVVSVSWISRELKMSISAVKLLLKLLK